MAANRARKQRQTRQVPDEIMALDDTTTTVQSIAKTEWPATRDAVHAKLLNGLTAQYPKVETHLDPREASALLASLRLELERAADDVSRPYPPAQWLWYLRRLPEIFEGELSTTAPYDQLLAEALSASSPALLHDWPADNGQTVFPVMHGVIRRVLRLCATATAISSLHSTIRRAGKGQAIEFGDAAFPQSVRDMTTDTAIELYDTRMAAGNSGVVSGTRIFRPYDGQSSSLPLTLVNRLPQWDVVATRLGSVQNGSEIRAWGKYAPIFLQLDGLEKIVKATPGHAKGWWHPELPALVVLLQGLSLYLTLHTTHGWLSLSRYGYLTIRREDLLSFVEFVLPGLHGQLGELFPGLEELNAESVIGTLLAAKAQPWPLLPGPVLRTGADHVLVDLDAAGTRLAKLLVVAPSGGPLANERGSHFEDVVQELIDASPWRPGSRLRDLRNRTLQLADDTALTDLDALGEHGNRLLIVSCKSFPMTLEYDAGDYGAVRNVASNLASAVRKWNQVVRALTVSPTGRNFDLSAFSKVIGVVCTPTIPYLPLGPDTEDRDISPAASLRAVSSYEELASWLRS